MQFNKVALLSGLSLLVGSIVVPASSSVNQNTTSEHYIKRRDTEADGRWYAIASVTAFWERLFVDSGWNAATTSAALQGGCDRASRVRVFQVGNLLSGPTQSVPRSAC